MAGICQRTRRRSASPRWPTVSRASTLTIGASLSARAKIGELAAFASAIILGMIALYIGVESAGRLLHPVAIGFSQAIPIAVVGLLVNLASVLLLQDDEHEHGHDHGHAHSAHGHRHDDDHRHGHDTNFRAAYVHVLADALTSVLAIVALLAAASVA